jgi:hypothetical protein
LALSLAEGWPSMAKRSRAGVIGKITIGIACAPPVPI